MNAQEGRVPGKRVLIVDDSVDTARMMKVLLEYEGHDVRTANDGLKALKAAGDFLPDVVLLDLLMPGMSGREVAEALRKDGAVSQTLIVAISGYDEDGVPPGFDHLMVKPVDHGALLKLIAGCERTAEIARRSPAVA
jgi:two-component system OmpR family response regulator